MLCTTQDHVFKYQPERMSHPCLLSTRICVPQHRCYSLWALAVQDDYKGKCTGGEVGKGGHLLSPIHLLFNLLHTYNYLFYRKNKINGREWRMANYDYVQFICSLLCWYSPGISWLPQMLKTSEFIPSNLSSMYNAIIRQCYFQRGLAAWNTRIWLLLKAGVEARLNCVLILSDYSNSERAQEWRRNELRKETL